MRNLLLVLSGGMDSCIVGFMAKNSGVYNHIHAISFEYGQRHYRELECALKIAQRLNVDSYEIIHVKEVLKSLSPLLTAKPTEKYKSYDHMVGKVGDKIEDTFVPMRNMLFLTIAANRAVLNDCSDVGIGVCSNDTANYPDCSKSFIQNIENTIAVSLKQLHFSIYAPLLELTKKQSILIANDLPGCMDALAYTHTSYDNEYPPKSKNHSNILRAQAFLEAGLPDPLVLRAHAEGLMPLPETRNYEVKDEVNSK